MSKERAIVAISLSPAQKRDLNAKVVQRSVERGEVITVSEFVREELGLESPQPQEPQAA
jgi:hypothetical protein